MKFAQLINDVALADGSSIRVAFGADNVQGIIVHSDNTDQWVDVKINANVGSTFCIARCSLKHLHQINAYNRGHDPHESSTGEDTATYIDLGSIWLNTNEELEIIIDNESGEAMDGLDLSVCYDGDQPNEIYTYQSLVDSNFARENCVQVWAFGSSLEENDEVVTIQDAMGSQSTKLKVYNAWTNTQQNSGTYDTSYAQCYEDDDSILQKVTTSITSMTNIDNWVVCCNDTNVTKQAKKNQDYVAKKKAKVASLNPQTLQLNKLSGKL